MTTTATETVPEIESGAEPDFPPYRMTIDRYMRLIEAGVFTEKDPVFLWRGRLVEKMTKGDRHVFAVTELYPFLIGLVPVGWFVRQEQPIAMGDRSMPEPDLTVIRGGNRDFRDRTPTVRDVALVIEVSDSSLAIDSRGVLRAYAAEGIPVYWIVNIPRGRVEVYRDPTGPGESSSYRERREYGPDDEVSVILDGREVGRVAVKEILP